MPSFLSGIARSPIDARARRQLGVLAPLERRTERGTLNAEGYTPRGTPDARRQRPRHVLRPVYDPQKVRAAIEIDLSSSEPFMKPHTKIGLPPMPVVCLLVELKRSAALRCGNSGFSDPSQTWAAQIFVAHLVAPSPISLGPLSCFDGQN